MIIGGFGQDGTILSELLNTHNVVYQVGRKRLISNETRSEYRFGLSPDHYESFRRFLSLISPDIVLYFAASHGSSTSELMTTHDRAKAAAESDLRDIGFTLKTLNSMGSRPVLFYSSSSHIYEGTESGRKSETSEFKGVSPYAKAKIAAMLMIEEVYPQDQYLLGILFHHHSALRRGDYALSKIVEFFVNRITGNSAEPLILRDPSARLDVMGATTLCQIVIELLSKDCRGRILVGSGRPRALNDIVATLSEKLGVSLPQASVDSISPTATSLYYYADTLSLTKLGIRVPDDIIDVLTDEIARKVNPINS